MKSQIVTSRLILRPWRDSDAESLYTYASDPKVGNPAGWNPHSSIEESRQIIRDIFSQPGVFAVTLKEDDTAIGCIGIICGNASNFEIPDNEGEISYWIGIPFWGKGYIPEAMKEIIRYGFEDLSLEKIWCGYFDGNIKSKRVQEKCGFKFHHTKEKEYYPIIDEWRIEHVTALSRQDWMQRTIRPAYPFEYPELVELWERSVRESHHFLKEHDLQTIKGNMTTLYLPSVKLYVIETSGEIKGFIGLLEDTVEMLFIEPDCQNSGYGSLLINFAIEKGMTKVDVNEQNPKALTFYQKRGFKIISRDPVDSDNRPYPILHLSKLSC